MKDEQVYLSHIISRCERIIEITASSTYESFLKDRDTQDIMIRSFEIIGEATTHFSEEFKKNHPKLLWKEMHVFRNVLIHQYFRLDLQEIWSIASSDIPEVYIQAKLLMDELEQT